MNEQRARIYAITINKGAECYNNIDERLNKIIGKEDKFAYIEHNKDSEIDEETGETKPKKDHLHLLLNFKNARGFNAILKAFEGAHIEVGYNESSWANYLLHNGKPEKYHYQSEEVITNNRPWYNSLLTSKALETFIEDKLPYYIFVEGFDTYLKLCLRFGAKQLPYGIDYKMNALKRDYAVLTKEKQEEINEQLIELYSEDNLPF